jgi:hypothetical protein
MWGSPRAAGAGCSRPPVAFSSATRPGRRRAFFLVSLFLPMTRWGALDAMRCVSCFGQNKKKKVSSGRGGDEVRCEPAAPAGGGVVIQVLVGALASHSSSSCESGVRIMGSDAVFTVHI